MSTMTSTKDFWKEAAISASFVNAACSRLHESQLLAPNSTSTCLFSRLAVWRAALMLCVASACGSKSVPPEPKDSADEEPRASANAEELALSDPGSSERSVRADFASAVAVDLPPGDHWGEPDSPSANLGPRR